jgi:predicted O-methyltransferase YrrM
MRSVFGLFSCTLLSVSVLEAVAVSQLLPVSYVDRPDLLELIDVAPGQLSGFQDIDAELASFAGWCHPIKAKWLYSIVRHLRPKVGCEVGVFGGASVFPAALAMAHNQQGSFIGIDPWEAAPCLQGYQAGDPNFDWWAKVDYSAIYRGFVQGMARNGLSNVVTALKMTGREAVNQVPELDYLHIDGNHSEESSTADVHNYAPKCRSGALIVMDDVNWDTTRKAQQELLKYADRIFVCEPVEGQAFAVYRKR